jgi:N-terminal domain of molybdenum-binding protein
MKTLLKLFVTKDDDDYILGPGRIRILRLVGEHGSLRKAAHSMGMSYRWAWGRIKKAEEAIGVPLLTDNPASNLKVKKLTRDAWEIIDWFSRTEDDLKKVLKQAELTQPQALKNGAPSTGEQAEKQ